MNKIKVYLQYPWKFPDSPYYKYLIQEVPKGIEYKNIEKQKGVITNKNFFWFSNFLKKNIRKWVTKLNLSFSNTHFSPKGNYDLIHCAHCLSKNKNKPWVADIESAWQFFIGKETKKSRRKVKKIILTKNCKKILPWTNKVKEDILKIFPELKNKIEVIYPTVPSIKKSKKFNEKKITLLFTGRYFYYKGGLHALEVIDKLTKKYKHVYGIFNSEIPEEISKKYSNNKKIKFYGLIPQKKLFELYEKSDVSIYPGYTDSFGFAYLESMAFGIPIVTVDGDSRKEIVTEDKTGFVINRPKNFSWKKIGGVESRIINEIVDKTSKLIENKKLLETMSKNCIKEISLGKFSIKERNKKLKRIYEEGVK
jgi:glycosyltransferase involved in cell wall biosynthesis